MNFKIIGAGPIGLATAILVTETDPNSSVEVFEKGEKDQFENPNVLDSYPLGLNPRGIQTLMAISKKLVAEIENISGERKEMLEIYRGKRQVAKLKAHGGTLEISRNELSSLLYKRCLLNPRIKVYFEKKLKDIDFVSQTLLFVDGESSNAKECRVIAADGCYSMTRSILIKKMGWKCRIHPWTFRFRVLYSKVNASSLLLNRKTHYLFTGSFTSFLNNRWTCTVGIRDSDPKEDHLLMESGTSLKYISVMRHFLQKRAPFLEKSIEDEEIEKFFERRVFQGVVVDCPIAHYNEWILLIGDAYHSVLPPTGQGINSGLEDCFVLASLLKSDNNPHTLFQKFQTERGPDIAALIQYAIYLNEDPWFIGEKLARILFRALESFILRESAISSRLFGSEVTSYRKVIGDWQNFQLFLLPLCRCFTYPLDCIPSLFENRDNQKNH